MNPYNLPVLLIDQPRHATVTDRSLVVMLSALVIALMAGAGVAQLQNLFGS